MKKTEREGKKGVCHWVINWGKGGVLKGSRGGNTHFQMRSHNKANDRPEDETGKEKKIGGRER